MSLLAYHACRLSPRKDATWVQCGQSVVTAAVAAEPGALLGEITVQRPHPFSGDPRSCRSPWVALQAPHSWASFRRAATPVTTGPAH